LNPHDRLRSADFKSAVSADFTIRAVPATAGAIFILLHSFVLQDAPLYEGTDLRFLSYKVSVRAPADGTDADQRDIQTDPNRTLGE